jgi:hypothetical protein
MTKCVRVLPDGRRGAAATPAPVVRMLRILTVTTLITLITLITGQPAHAEVIDRVLAVVGGSLITLSDVNAAFELGLVTPRPTGDPIREVLSTLIDRELQLAEVDRYAPPEPSAADVDREVQTVATRFASADAFEAVLGRSGIDLAHLRETMRENLRIRAYLDQRFAGRDVRRQQVVDEWIAGLRRRADIIDLYVAGR